MLRILALLIMVLLYLAPESVLAEEVYIWTDKNGVTHIEDQAPNVSPREKIKVEKHVYEKEAVVPPIVNPEAATLPAGSSSESAEDTAKKELELKAKEKELQRQQAIDKARQEYEEAKAQENHYIHKIKNAENSKARHYWKDKLEDIEEKRRQLEELESGE